jgi:hypothetical protein
VVGKVKFGAVQVLVATRDMTSGVPYSVYVSIPTHVKTCKRGICSGSFSDLRAVVKFGI